jgi:hypothetical protein
MRSEKGIGSEPVRCSAKLPVSLHEDGSEGSRRISGRRKIGNSPGPSGPVSGSIVPVKSTVVYPAIGGSTFKTGSFSLAAALSAKKVRAPTAQRSAIAAMRADPPGREGREVAGESSRPLRLLPLPSVDPAGAAFAKALTCCLSLIAARGA